MSMTDQNLPAVPVNVLSDEVAMQDWLSCWWPEPVLSGWNSLAMAGC